MRAQLIAAFFSIASIMGVSSPAVAQQQLSASDTALVQGYVLTVDKMKRYVAADAAIKHDKGLKPELAHEMAAASASGGELRPSVLLARLKRQPVTMSYYRAQGLSDVDAVVFPVVVVDSMLVGAQPSLSKQLPATPAQIAFVKAHRAELEKIGD